MPSGGSIQRRSAQRRKASSGSRPGFIVAALGVALLVVAGVVVSIQAAFGGDASGGDMTVGDGQRAAAPAGAAHAGPEHEVGDADTIATVSPSSCGLRGPEQTSPLPADRQLLIAPETSWRGIDVNLAPSSPEAGPAAMHEGGFGYCFQRSADGALFAAANFLVQSNTPALRAPLLDYALAAGQHRDSLLASSGAEGSGVRLQIVGYRMLAFDGDTARVDVAQRVSVDGASSFIAAVVDLVWIDGDWRIPSDEPAPVRLQSLGDVGGYVRWSA
ncbi:hypothetical protein [Pseudoclavibacter sp. 8L]|uniref:hypothetical protein n=1 Tax=Pseudoclavibacter sp. 8L TaxID=2653162 RepID=UPI0012EFCD39|nr:hypothetical protein [Pseudoclavibacter sp. 8L]VXB63741.1 conserved exported hypothetical protein [Pseudoclavibacter sp. 8L]